MTIRSTAANNSPSLTTGIDFLDRVLGGGQLPQGVHGLLGPIASGKTTLATMLAAEGAQRLHRDRQAGIWAFVSIDEREDYIWHRAVSHAARLPREIAASGESIGQLIETGACQALTAILTEHLRVIDSSQLRFANSPPFNHTSDSVRQISEALSLLDRPVAGVVIDYAGLAIRRSTQNDTQISERIVSRKLREFVVNSRAELALRYQCPVWIIHQLNGNANRRSAGMSQHHRDAAGCRSFGRGLDICAVLGTTDQQSSCMLLTCTKSPFLNTSTAPVVLRFHPEIATIEESQTHRHSSVNCRIESNSVRAKFDDATLRALGRLQSQ